MPVRPAAAAAVGRGAGNTLTRLRWWRAAALLFPLLLAVVEAGSAGPTQEALRRTESQVLPGLVAADHLRSALMRMDGAFASEGHAGGSDGARRSEHYATEQDEVLRDLIGLAEDGGAERGEIEGLQTGLGAYQERVQRARDLRERGEPAATAVLHEAEQQMDEVLLPEAQALATAREHELQGIAAAQRFRTGSTRLLLLAMTLGSLAALIGAQLFLSRRMRRTFNPALLLATLLSGAVSLHDAVTLTQAQTAFSEVVQNGFGAVHPLLEARIAVDRIGEVQSRLGLPGEDLRADRGELANLEEHLVTLPEGLTREQVATALLQGRTVEGFRGLLAESAEREPSWSARDRIAEVLRAVSPVLARETKDTAADLPGTAGARAALHSRAESGEGNASGYWASAEFEQAYGEAIAGDQDRVQQQLSEAAKRVGRAEELSAVAAGVCIILVIWGFAPRLREYAAG